MISKNKAVYLLDEPTSNLDDESKNNFINILGSHFSNKIVIVITHDID